MNQEITNRVFEEMEEKFNLSNSAELDKRMEELFKRLNGKLYHKHFEDLEIINTSIEHMPVYDIYFTEDKVWPYLNRGTPETFLLMEYLLLFYINCMVEMVNTENAENYMNKENQKQLLLLDKNEPYSCSAVYALLDYLTSVLSKADSWTCLHTENSSIDGYISHQEYEKVINFTLSKLIESECMILIDQFIGIYNANFSVINYFQEQQFKYLKIVRYTLSRNKTFQKYRK